MNALSQSPITTHVLDLASGRPAEGVGILLEREEGDVWLAVGRGATDTDGRLKSLLPPGRLMRGAYRLTFDIGSYFTAKGATSFYASVPIQFVVEREDQHYHVPLLVSPFGYSTYRGS